jgi:glucose-1-phosphatase
VTEFVLFDLGGVLVKVPGVETMRQLAGIEDSTEVWRRWLACEWVRSFERGHCTDVDFAAGLVADWNLSITGEEFLAAFERWPDGLYDGALDLIDSVRTKARVGCLSNTNHAHWSQMSAWGLEERFEVKFLSHEMGMVKPDQEIFEYVTATLDIPAERVLFLDDNSVNVEQAASLGFDAVLARGLDGARQILIERGLLVSP